MSFGLGSGCDMDPGRLIGMGMRARLRLGMNAPAMETRDAITRRGANPFRHLVNGTAFQQVIRGAVLQRPLAPQRIVRGGKHQDVGRAGQRADGADGVQSVPVAHLDVEQDDIRPGFAGQFAEQGVRGFKQPCAMDAGLQTQGFRHDRPDLGVVVHQPDIDGVGRRIEGGMGADAGSRRRQGVLVGGIERKIFHAPLRSLKDARRRAQTMIDG